MLQVSENKYKEHNWINADALVADVCTCCCPVLHLALSQEAVHARGIAMRASIHPPPHAPHAVWMLGQMITVRMNNPSNPSTVCLDAGTGDVGSMITFQNCTQNTTVSHRVEF